MQVKWGIDLSFTPFKPAPARLPPSCCVLWSQTCFPSPIYYNLLLTKFPPSLLKMPLFLKQCFSSPKNHSLQTSLVNIRNIVLLPINRHFNCFNIFYWMLLQNFKVSNPSLNYIVALMVCKQRWSLIIDGLKESDKLRNSPRKSQTCHTKLIFSKYCAK